MGSHSATTILGSGARLMAALRGEVPYDVLVLTGAEDAPAEQNAQHQGAHRAVLLARCPAMSSRMTRRSAVGLGAAFSDIEWELDLRGLCRNSACAAALLEYLYTDFCRAAFTLAPELRLVAEQLGLERLAVAATLACGGSSADEGVRWVRTAGGKWEQQASEEGSATRVPPSTYAKDMEALVATIDSASGSGASQKKGEAPASDFVVLRVCQPNGVCTQTVRVARCLLMTVDFFRAMLEGNFAEAEQLRGGAGEPLELHSESPDALVLCLRLLPLSEAEARKALRQAVPCALLLAVLEEAHRLELQDLLVAAENALCESRAAITARGSAGGCEAEEAEWLEEALTRASCLYGLPRLTSVAPSLEAEPESERERRGALGSCADVEEVCSNAQQALPTAPSAFF